MSFWITIPVEQGLHVSIAQKQKWVSVGSIW